MLVKLLEKANIEYRGWLPNYKVPEVFSRFRMTAHVPRRPYVEKLSGIPTIRPFEAMACGIPLLCSTWFDSENLFTAGKDYLLANTGDEMKQNMKLVLKNNNVSDSLSQTCIGNHTKTGTLVFTGQTSCFNIVEQTRENIAQTAIRFKNFQKTNTI